MRLVAITAAVGFVVGCGPSRGAGADLGLPDAGAADFAGTTWRGLGAARPIDCGPRVTTIDADGDGHIDVLGWGSDGSLRWCAGRGDGTFAAAVVVGSASPFAIRAADFDGDGVFDLVLTGFLFGNAYNFWLETARGSRPASFAAPVKIADLGNASLGGPPEPTVVLADFDGDGTLDIAAANRGDAPGFGDARLLLGRGDLTFSNGQWPGPDSAAVAAGDFDGDGAIDLATLELADHAVHLFHNDGKATFAPGFASAPVAGAEIIAAADFDHDGRADVLVIGDAPAATRVYLSGVDGTLRAAGTVDVATSIVAGAPRPSPLFADFDGDGHLDFVFVGKQAVLALGHGDGSFDIAPLVATESSAVGDFDSDGWPDLLGPTGVRLNLGR